MYSFNINDTFEQHFSLSPGVYEGFIKIFEDKNPLHTSPDFAMARGFNGCVMHGNILNGFLSYFVGQCLPIKNVIIHSQQIQFKTPVYLNDKLLLKATVTNVSESVGAVEFKFSFVNEQSKTVAKGTLQIGLI